MDLLTNGKILRMEFMKTKTKNVSPYDAFVLNNGKNSSFFRWKKEGEGKEYSPDLIHLYIIQFF